MKYLPVILAAIFGVGCSNYQTVNTGSGKILTKELAMGNFNQIEASGSVEFDVMQGDIASVVVTADDNLWDFLDVRNEGGTLLLNVKPGSYKNMHFSAKVVMPHLTALKMTGATKGAIHDFKDTTGRLDLDLSGASKLVGGLQQGGVKLDASGASMAELVGSTNTMDITLSGASRCDLDKFTSGKTRVDLSGASNASVTARQTLSYDLSGASHLSYAGSPAVDHATVTGASSVNPVQ